MASGFEFNGRYLAQQMRKPVLFLREILNIKSQNLVDEKAIRIDIGLKQTTTAMVRAILSVSQGRMLPSLMVKDVPEERWLCNSLVRGYKAGLKTD